MFFWSSGKRILGGQYLRIDLVFYPRVFRLLDPSAYGQHLKDLLTNGLIASFFSSAFLEARLQCYYGQEIIRC